MQNQLKKIALEARLRKCENVITLGVKPNFSDYSSENIKMINNAEKIYYPAIFYADLFDAMGKKIFPSVQTYRFAQDKIKQTALFMLLGLPHPKTRTFYGKRQKLSIKHYFDFPFIAKIPRGSAMGRGVFMIKNSEDLFDYTKENHAAYIQEYLPADRDLRVVIIGNRVVHAYWRIAKPGEFRSNIAAGGHIELNNIPKEAIDLALFTAEKAGWNDVGLDIIKSNGKFYVIEANMKYGKEGFKKSGIDYIKLMERMIENGEI